MSRPRWSALACAVALVAAGCGEPAFEAPTAPTSTSSTTTSSSGTTTAETPVAPTKSETFAGTLTPGERSFYAFTVSAYGRVDVTLESLADAVGPVASTIEIGIGQLVGTGCETSTRVNARVAAEPALSETLKIGIYCVQVAETSTLARPADFSIRLDIP